VAKKKGGGKGPGAMSMGGMGKKPSMMSTPMASAPTGPPGGLGGPGPAGPDPGPLGVKKGGSVTKHAKGGPAEGSPAEERRESKAFEKKEDRGSKYAHGGAVTKFAMGGDVKARVRGGGGHC
jgi:hypothetical protein